MQGELFGDIGRRPQRSVGAEPGPEYHIKPSQRSSRKRWVADHADGLKRYLQNYRKTHRASLARKKLAAARAA